MPRNPARPTIATIARDLGISPATVSYALNGKPGVGAETRERVLAHAREVGWTPHSGARALRQGRSGNLGLVLARDPHEVSHEPFFAALTAGIQAAASGGGRELLLRFVGGGAAEEMEVLAGWAEQRRVDGVLLLDVLEDDPRPRRLAELGLPFVVLGAWDGPERCGRMVVAEETDARTLVDHLVAAGSDACLQITGPLAYVHEQRRRAFVASQCAAHGIAHAAVEAPYTREGGEAAVAQLPLDLGEHPAVLASSDLLALGAQRTLLAAGHRVPADVAVLSWDDSAIAENVSPPITALSRQPYAQGEAAGALLVGLLDGTVTAGTVVRSDPSELRVRTSTRIGGGSALTASSPPRDTSSRID